MKRRVDLNLSQQCRVWRWVGPVLFPALAIIFPVGSVIAQTPPVIQTGFVAVKPVVGTGLGLMVFGRVQFENGDDVLQTTVWAPSVVTITALVASSDSSVGRDTGIAIANPTNFAAEITLTLRNDQGNVVASRTIVLSALHQVSRFVGELFGVNATGLLSIISTAPIALVGIQFDGASFSAVPTVGPPGEIALLLPQFATGGGWSTEVVIANATGLAQIIDVDFFDQNGIIVATKRNVNLPPAGVIRVNR
jgi:hypothetical protein